MEALLKEYRELPFWKHEDWVVENYKKIFVHDSPFTEEQLDTLNDMFGTQIDAIFRHEDTGYDLFDYYFQLENFYPSFYNKDVGSGSWIRMKTETGYNVYWAKKAPQKRMSEEQLQRQYKKIDRLPKKTSAQCQKVLDIFEEIRVATLLKEFPHELVFTKIMRTRTKSEFVLPYQYEVVTDITLYTAVINDKMNQGAVKYKSYFTKQDEDQIFYMQSRGIDRDTAVLMCKLQQVYFVIDTTKLFANWMQPVKLVEK